jgi:hypothetical protein
LGVLIEDDFQCFVLSPFKVIYQSKMSSDNPKSSTVAITIITTLGVIGGAIFTNWDKIFSSSTPVTPVPGPSSTPSPSPSQTASSTPSPSPSSTQTPSPSSTQTPTNRLLLGIWYSEASCSEGGYAMTILGTSEYLRNRGINYVGEMSLLGKYNGNNVQVTYSIQTTGEWMLEEDKLIEKMVDIRSYPKSVKIDAVEFDLQQLQEQDPTLLDNFPKIEHYIPKGGSSESTILSINESTMKVRSETAICGGTMELEKRGKTFSALPQVQIFWKI